MSLSLAEIMSPHQHDFIKGRSIYDNVLAAMMVMEYARFTRQECVLLHDRVSWSYVHETLQSLGFEPRICQALRVLGEGSSSQLLFNSRIVGSFEVQRYQAGMPSSTSPFRSLHTPANSQPRKCSQQGRNQGTSDIERETITNENVR